MSHDTLAPPCHLGQTGNKAYIELYPQYTVCIVAIDLHY